MEVLECQQDICSVEFGCILLEAANLAEVKEQLATRAVLKAEVQFALGLKGVVHFDNKFVIYAFKNATLVKRVLQLIATQDLILLQDLQRIHLFGVFLLH